MLGVLLFGPQVNAQAAGYSAMLMLISTACFSAVALTHHDDGTYSLVALPSLTTKSTTWIIRSIGLTDFRFVLVLGCVVIVIFLLVIPWRYIRKMRKGLTPRAQWRDGLIAVGQPMWRGTFQARMGYLFLRYRPGSWCDQGRHNIYKTKYGDTQDMAQTIRLPHCAFSFSAKSNRAPAVPPRQCS